LRIGSRRQERFQVDLVASLPFSCRVMSVRMPFANLNSIFTGITIGPVSFPYTSSSFICNP